MVAQSSDVPKRQKNKKNRSIGKIKRARPRGLGGLLARPDIVHDKRDLRAYARESVEGDAGWDAITFGMMKASCAFFALEVLRGPPEPPYNGKFLIGPHHYKWSNLLRDHDRLCILAPRDHGKCQRGDALILTPLGERVRIDKWKGGYLWSYDIDTRDWVKAYAPASRSNGVKRVLHVTTRSGRRETVTENHPFRLWDSWKRADELEVGERIGVAYESPSEAVGSVDDAWLIGLLVGDGGLTGSNVVLSTGDSLVLKAAKGLCDVRHASGPDYRLLGMQGRMRELGLMGKNSHTKRVPQEVFTSKNSDVAEFVAGYLDADAHVNPLGGGSVEFYSVNLALLRDVQHLLTRLGILAVLTKKLGSYDGQPHRSWRLTIRGKDLLTLAAKVFPRGNRAVALERVVAIQREKKATSGDCVDRFPAEVWGLLKNGEDWFRRNGYARPSKQYAPTREKLLKVAQAEDNQELADLSQSPVFWDEVVSVEDGGEVETWSIHVPGFENYLADDVINHNTFFFNLAYPLWKATTIRGGKGYIFSATQEQAIRILGDVKDELISNPRLRHLVPPKGSGNKWAATQIQLTNGHTIYARGYGTKVRGGHPHWLVVDDGLNDESSYSEVVRNKQKEYFFSALSNMVVPGGQIIVVGTPFHQSDLYAELAENKRYYFERFQALVGKEEVPLWPSRYDKKALEAKRIEIGTIRFTREFQCEPIGDSMSLFPLYLFQGTMVECPTITLGMPKAYWDALGLTIYMGVDFAMSASVNADFMVVWVMGVDKLGNRWIVDIHRHKGLPYQQQLSLINSVGKKYDPALVYLEANQMQRIFGDELIRTTDLPIYKYVTGVEKNSLDKGVPSLRVLLENGKFKIPRGDANSVELTDIWINEMRAFTWVDGGMKSVGTHDDTVMGCWICDQAVRRGGFAFDFGEDLEDSTENLDDVLREMNEDPKEVEEKQADDSYVENLDDGLESDLGDPDILGLDGLVVGGIPMMGGSLGY